MSYKINHFNGALIATINDGTIDNTLDITLVGKNYAGYGKTQNENFVYLLENFAGSNPPPSPTVGQTWYDSGNRKLKFYDGSKFRVAGSAEISATEPTGLTIGDLWFDTTNNQLHTFTGTKFTLIGPQIAAGAGATEMRLTSVRDSDGISRPIIEAVNGDNVVFIVSKDTFIVDSTANDITGYTKIHGGITMYNTDETTGVTNDDVHKFWGTASNADLLSGHSIDDFVLAAGGSFAQPVNFSDLGYTVGNPTERLKVWNRNAQIPTIENIKDDEIVFSTTVDTVSVTPLRLKGVHILPGETDKTDIGSSTYMFKTVWASVFEGNARTADQLKIGSTYHSTSTAADPTTVVARTTVDEAIGSKTITAGAIKATYFVGTATTAQYADLAENYLADAVYEPGTVVCIGGEKEVTASSWGKRAIGAVSTDPAYLMNSELVDGTPIALKGRVPVKVIGRIKKGEELIAADNGCAMMAVPHASRVFAVALETNDDEGIKLVECLIL